MFLHFISVVKIMVAVVYVHVAVHLNMYDTHVSTNVTELSFQNCC